MKIKDIVNRDIVNLENCEQEPIHIPGSIQPHGCLLGIDATSFKVNFASENTEQFIGISYRQLLDKTIEEIFDAGIDAKIKEYIAGIPNLTTLRTRINDRDLSLNIHLSGADYIIEVEPDIAHDNQYPDVFNQTRQFLSYMEQSLSLQELCQMIADRTRHIAGYDRVMIYRFDEEYNGEVFAESVRADLEPFFGLHYPHTDIPVQARQLYIKNMMRLIVDTGYEPVPLYTVDKGSDENLDLSLSFLRSISPIHIQYLQNMGVGATLTISILHKHRLWGLIACHHYSPRNIPPDIRIASQLQGHFIASQIDVRQSTEEYDVSLKISEAADITQRLMKTSDSFEAIVNAPGILNICNASGVCIIFNGTLYTGGVTPSHERINQLVIALFSTYHETGLDTPHLSGKIPGTEDMSDTAAGIIYQPLSGLNNDCIIWFRPETEKEVHWGGDPNKAIIKDERGLHPRKSFELWKEIVKHKSKPWLKPEINGATNFAYGLQKHMALLLISASEDRYRKMAEVLKANNEELENLNWISAHDMQEPLRKIQMLASRLLQQKTVLDADKTKEMVTRVNDAASRMQTLLRDILNYSKMRYNEEAFAQADLNAIVTSVIADFDDQVKEIGAQVNMGPLPVIKGISFLLAQLFTNLIANALKFSDKEKQQLITINATPFVSDEGGNYYCVKVSDSGIGFDEKYATQIFRIFSRLNNNADYEGSGVGLALCKKIMEMHDGFISATGKPGEGAVFSLYFPADMHR